MNFLFWNTRGRDLRASIGRLARRHELDFLILAEARLPDAAVARVLSEATNRRFHFAPGLAPALQVFSVHNPSFVTPLLESDRYSIRRVQLPLLLDFLIAVAHLPSRMFVSAESQVALFFELSTDIKAVETSVGHQRTILVGDLNANPFDAGVVSAVGLNAVMTRRLAARGARTVQRRSYPFFYNPMWRLMGDEQPGPAGSYYYGRAEDIQYFWHTHDQVLVRPSMLAMLPSSGIEFVTRDGRNSFLDANGRPNQRDFSDHLPLFFRLAIEV